jgi:hypothetical protein
MDVKDVVELTTMMTTSVEQAVKDGGHDPLTRRERILVAAISGAVVGLLTTMAQAAEQMAAQGPTQAEP